MPARTRADDTGVAAQLHGAFGRLTLLGSSVLVLAIGGLFGVFSSGIALFVGIVLLMISLRTEEIARPGGSRFRLLPTGVYRINSVSGAASLALALMMGGTTAIRSITPSAAIEILRSNLRASWR